jgi:uncharacterized membrane protein YoaK (UPF0700 family)
MMKYWKLAGKHRKGHRNLTLGLILAMIAGAINAGGFVLVMRYTSHMTGIISLVANSAVIGEYDTAISLVSFIVCFIFGATCTTLIALFARRYNLHSQFALPLLLEALSLATFSLLWFVLEPQDSVISYFVVVYSCSSSDYSCLPAGGQFQ